MNKKAIPLGVKVVAFLFLFQVAAAVLNFLGWVVVLNLPDEAKSQLIETSEFNQALNIKSIEQLNSFCKMVFRDALMPFNLMINVFMLVLAFGLFNLKNWARIVTVPFSCFSIAVNIWFLWSHPSLNPAQYVGKFVSFILYGAIIIYFTRAKVKEQFKGPPPNSVDSGEGQG